MQSDTPSPHTSGLVGSFYRAVLAVGGWSVRPSVPGPD